MLKIDKRLKLVNLIISLHIYAAKSTGRCAIYGLILTRLPSSHASTLAPSVPQVKQAVHGMRAGCAAALSVEQVQKRIKTNYFEFRG